MSAVVVAVEGSAMACCPQPCTAVSFRGHGEHKIRGRAMFGSRHIAMLSRFVVRRGRESGAGASVAQQYRRYWTSIIRSITLSMLLQSLGRLGPTRLLNFQVLVQHVERSSQRLLISNYGKHPVARLVMWCFRDRDACS